MNDNDGLTKPRPALFGTDIPDPRTLVEDYEITAAYDGDLTGMPASHILAWIAILTLIGLSMYSIVWGI